MIQPAAAQPKPLPVRVFLDAVEKWCLAINECRAEDAKFQAEQLKNVGKLLAFDPEFKRIFLANKDHCYDQDPDHILNCIYAFFHAVTDAACSGTYRRPIDRS